MVEPAGKRRRKRVGKIFCNPGWSPLYDSAVLAITYSTATIMIRSAQLGLLKKTIDCILIKARDIHLN